MRVSTWQLHHHHLQPSKTHFSSGRCSWSSTLWDLDRALTTSMGTVYLFMTLSRLIKCVLLGALPPLGGSGHTRTPVHTHACAPPRRGCLHPHRPFGDLCRVPMSWWPHITSHPWVNVVITPRFVPAGDVGSGWLQPGRILLSGEEHPPQNAGRNGKFETKSVSYLHTLEAAAM